MVFFYHFVLSHFSSSSIFCLLLFYSSICNVYINKYLDHFQTWYVDWVSKRRLRFTTFLLEQTREIERETGEREKKKERERGERERQIFCFFIPFSQSRFPSFLFLFFNLQRNFMRPY